MPQSFPHYPFHNGFRPRGFKERKNIYHRKKLARSANSLTAKSTDSISVKVYHYLRQNRKRYNDIYMILAGQFKFISIQTLTCFRWNPKKIARLFSPNIRILHKPFSLPADACLNVLATFVYRMQLTGLKSTLHLSMLCCRNGRSLLLHLLTQNRKDCVRTTRK